jgi:hypothetical protein
MTADERKNVFRHQKSEFQKKSNRCDHYRYLSTVYMRVCCVLCCECVGVYVYRFSQFIFFVLFEVRMNEEGKIFFLFCNVFFVYLKR